MLGQKIFFKFPSFNIWGAGAELLSVVPAYTYTIVGAIGLPGSVSSLNLAGNVLTWPTVQETDVAGYRIKFQYGSNTDWTTGTLLHTGLVSSSPYTMLSRPVGAATIMVKAVDFAGHESATPAYVIANLGNPLVANVVESYDYGASAYQGSFTNATVAAPVLSATQSSPFYVINGAAALYGNALKPFYSTNYDALSWVSTPWTPDRAATGSNLTLVFGLAGQGQLIQYRPTGPNPFYATVGATPFYGLSTANFYAAPPDWITWPGSIVATPQAYQWQVTTTSGPVQGVISGFVAQVDVPDVVLTLNNIPILAAGTRLAGAIGLFQNIQNIQITLLAGTATAIQIIDKSTTLGPLVQAFNSAGVAVAATIDAFLQGY